MGQSVKVNLVLNPDNEQDKKAIEVLSGEVLASDRKKMLLSFLDKPKPKKPINKTEFTLRLFSLVLSVFLVILSVHFTYEFNALVMAKFWAFLLSFSLVLFTAVAMAIATYCPLKSRLFFYFLWTISISYSVFTAFAGQYNQFRSYTAQEVETNVDKTLVLVQEQLDEITAQIDSYKESQKPYAELIKDLSSSPERKVEYPQTWRDANRNFNQLQSKIDDLVLKQSELLRQQLELSHTSSQVKNKTVYSWLAQLLHFPADLLQFFIMSLPAAFIDLTSSLLVWFALGERKSRPHIEEVVDK